MTTLQLYMLYGVIFGFMGTAIVAMIVAMILLMIKIKKMRKNPIDILVVEFFKDSFRAREEIGRYEFNDLHGTILVTSDKKGRIKDNLGNKISENFLMPKSNVGMKQILYGTRRFVVVGLKDIIPAPLYPLTIKKSYTDSEKKIVEAYNKILPQVAEIDKGIFPIPMDDNPETFSLKPVRSEQIKFVLDVNRELQTNFKMDEWNQIMKKLIRMFVPMVIIFLLVVCIVFIFLMIYGGSIAQIGQTAAQKAVNKIPDYYQGIVNGTRLPI